MSKATLYVAMTQSMPKRGGLWMPETIPSLELKPDSDMFSCMFKVTRCLLDAHEVPDKVLEEAIRSTFNFPIPLVHVENKIYVSELFHGPTYTFKDVGARFMSRILRHLVPIDTKIHVVVATSGDTGSAIADAFEAVPNVCTNVFYPSGLISRVQEKQITLKRDSVKAFRCEGGNFDDCQKMVKEILRDRGLLHDAFIFTGNSINILRLIPQVTYYFWTYLQYLNGTGNMYGTLIDVVVPSGNMGNVTAGAIAKRMGLPIRKLIVATNANDTFGIYLRTGKICDRRAIPTYSSAMDISIPNNLIRLRYLYGNDHLQMQKDIESYCIDDAETLDVIQDTYDRTGYMLDPHTSVGYAASKRRSPVATVILATAHPAKFPAILKRVDLIPPKPESMDAVMNSESEAITIQPDYAKWRITFMAEYGKNITLIGMPTAGKTYLGKRLAMKLGKAVIDTDVHIQNIYGKSLKDLIAEVGNDGFLGLEASAIQSLDGIKNTVICTGGSVVYNDSAMAHLRSMSTIMFIDCSEEAITQRLSEEQAKVRGVVLRPGQTIRDLWRERHPLYVKFADVIAQSDSFVEVLDLQEAYLKS